jgi:hypothetical protein
MYAQLLVADADERASREGRVGICIEAKKEDGNRGGFAS